MIILPSFTKRSYPSADLILINGDVYTVNPAMPQARALVIKGNKIMAVCERDHEAKKYFGQNTRLIDLKGKFVLPGLTDAHVHFHCRGALINDANLITVSDEMGLRKEILQAEIVYHCRGENRLPETIN